MLCLIPLMPGFERAARDCGHRLPAVMLYPGGGCSLTPVQCGKESKNGRKNPKPQLRKFKAELGSLFPAPPPGREAAGAVVYAAAGEMPRPGLEPLAAGSSLSCRPFPAAPAPRLRQRDVPRPLAGSGRTADSLPASSAASVPVCLALGLAPTDQFAAP